MLFTLVKNELIKIFRRGKTWVVFGLFAILIIGSTFLVKDNADRMEFYNSTEGQIESYEKDLKYEKQWLNEAKANGDQESVRNAEENIKHYEEEIATLKSIAENKDDPNQWKALLEEEKTSLQQIIDDKTIPDNEKAYDKQRIETINYYLDKDIEPIEIWEFNGVNYSLLLFELLGMVILACGIAVFMSDIVSGECTPATLKFLLVQPISRGKVLLSKFIAIVISVVALIGGLEVLVFGVLSAFTGIDAAKMPTIVGTRYQLDYSTVATQGSPSLTEIAGSSSMITRGEFLAQGFALQLLFIVTCCAFIFMISALFKSSMVTMAISVVLTVVLTVICNMSSTIAKAAHLIFFNYGNPSSILDGSIANQYMNTNFSVGTGIVVMVVTILVSYLIGYFVFKKKDILI